MLKDPVKRKEYMEKYYLKNKTKLIAYSKEYYINNRLERLEYRKEHYKNNKEYTQTMARVYSKKWRKANKAKSNFYTYKRRALLKGCTSKDADMEKIKEFYLLAEKMTNNLGIKYVVDHIKPLSKGGLHHPDNLQVITMKDNLIKFNKFPFDVVDTYKPTYFNPNLVQLEHT
jgi:5-methylcytosine-specific restriction endonuclease McrA